MPGLLDDDPDFWDEDIASMNLSAIEKNGLQVFRNYEREFERRNEEKFKQQADETSPDLSRLSRLLELICEDDARFLPVIACSYADEILEEMYQDYIPEDFPGGKKEIFGPYGPLSNLASRIQLAYLFDMVSKNLLLSLHALRKLRNRISHKWDETEVKHLLSSPHFQDIEKVELSLNDGKRLPEDIDKTVSVLGLFRIRVIWIMSRLTYECLYYNLAKQSRISPSALYGPRRPNLLSEIAGKAVACTRRVVSDPSYKLGQDH